MTLVYFSKSNILEFGYKIIFKKKNKQNILPQTGISIPESLHAVYLVNLK